MDTIKQSTDAQYQMQFWNGKQFEPTPAILSAPTRADLDYFADTARIIANGRPWRICDPARDLKQPRKWSNKQIHRASSRSVRDVQDAYVKWAVAKGLGQITEYAERPVSLCGAFTVKRITLADQMHVEETTEDTV